MKKHLLFVAAVFTTSFTVAQKQPVDYVNPYMGNISHLLVPTFPTVHLPNSMVRVYPNRPDFTADIIEGFPLCLSSHRGSFVFYISPTQGNPEQPVISYTYDNEVIHPYRYQAYLDSAHIAVDFAPSHQSAVYNFRFDDKGENKIVISTVSKIPDANDAGVGGSSFIDDSHTRMYYFLQWQEKPLAIKSIANSDAVVINFGNSKQVHLRYGVSFISEEQARKNLERELHTYDANVVANTAKETWNKTLGKIAVSGGSENDKTVFYTSLYRTYERCIDISEDGKYYSPFDEKVHNDEGTNAFADDWIWDTYRAVHPLRILIEPKIESAIIQSFVRNAQQSKEGWLPMFPLITGDGHAMNGNHGVSVIADAYTKGLRGFDANAAFAAAKLTLTKKSLIPWTRTGLTSIDSFYFTKGYYPAIYKEEDETVKQVGWEKRQPVPVTLGKCYDDWAMAQFAKALNKQDDYKYFLQASYNYRNLFNSNTAFFHPKDAEGKFIEPFDYRYSGGLGARMFYDENNGWVFRWDVQHNIGDLVKLHGGAEKFVANLDAMFREPLGKSKFEFYAQLPDHTGNVGQFSMANEPSLHIPYLYNYAGAPYKTQKRIRQLLQYFFRNDLEGVPGDEDGGGTSAFVVFSALGFYPVTPASASYNIGSPLFTSAVIKLANGKPFTIEAKGCSDKNKYIQAAYLNGKVWNKPWFKHSDIINGGKLVLIMGDVANTKWGSNLQDAPPSAEAIN